jgi:poly(3-hydroxybutyrate) depolymerase
MYEPIGRPFANSAFYWPAFVAASASEIAAQAAKQFAALTGGPDGPTVPEPQWASPHTVALELKTVRLRDFTAEAKGSPALVCAPFALHGASVADFATKHSLVAALSRAGVQRLFVTDWRSATTEMRFLGIDDYLADLNVIVDEIGGSADLVGLCQGGWMALVYAARFPAKVRKLVLAGAPIDIAAGSSALSTVADATPLAIFDELVRLGDGLALGRRVQKFWGVESVAAADVRQLLQIEETLGAAAVARLEALFRDWYAWTVNLPGAYFLEVVERLYKRNEIATGNFVALGQRIDLTAVKVPMFLLAARDDELVAPAQVFAAERLVGTSTRNVRKALVPCRHLGLFMGKAILQETWPRVADWIGKPSLAGPRTRLAWRDPLQAASRV